MAQKATEIVTDYDEEDGRHHEDSLRHELSGCHAQEEGEDGGHRSGVDDATDAGVVDLAPVASNQNPTRHCLEK